jgi:FkbM family methyltransferase
MGRPECICNHHLFLDPLGPESVVLDLGAYEGEFSREVSHRTGARAVAVEANPIMFERAYRSDRVEKLQLAVGDREGRVSLYLGSNPLGTSLFSGHPGASEQAVVVPATTLAKLISDHCGGRLDLLKVNIEGAEIPMLGCAEDRTLQSIGQITIQFHDFLPELDQVEDVRLAKQRLRRLGFREILFKSPNKDVLFVNLHAGTLSRLRFESEKLLVLVRQYLRAERKRLSAAFHLGSRPPS